jgi:hypothetical protein
MKAVFQGIAERATGQVLDERLDERAGAHRPPDPADPCPLSRLSGTTPVPTG